MRRVLPGQPCPRLQAVSAAQWSDQQLVAYVTGTGLVILDGNNILLQTIYNDDDLNFDSVAIDGGSGKIATSSGTRVRIYAPYGQQEGALKWSLHASLTGDENQDISTLSWGQEEELLVGNSNLSLYSIHHEPCAIWKQRLANPVKIAEISYDSGYIASTSHRDRLVKVWRRLSYGSEDVRFDVTYLHHPQAIADIRWRQPHHPDQLVENVLYTFCVDNKLRIWAATDPHGVQILQLWAEIDLVECIKPRIPISDRIANSRYAFIVDGKDFGRATEFAVRQGSVDKEENHALEHLVEIANRCPEVCVVLDGNGNMSAWGLEIVGSKNCETSSIFNLSHVSGLSFGLSLGAADDFLRIHNYSFEPAGALKILVHHFDGRISCYESNVSHLLDPTNQSDKILYKETLTGHSDPITMLLSESSGAAVVSSTDKNEIIIWKHSRTTILRRWSRFYPEHKVLGLCDLEACTFMVCLHSASLSFWDCRSPQARQLCIQPHCMDHDPRFVLLIHRDQGNKDLVHIAVINSNLEGVLWQMQPPWPTISSMGPDLGGRFEKLCAFRLDDGEELLHMLPIAAVEPQRSSADRLDALASDTVVTLTSSGRLQLCRLKVDLSKRCADWSSIYSLETGVDNAAVVSANTGGKVALVSSDGSHLHIWDVHCGQVEFSENYQHDLIRHLKWNVSPDGHCVLAIGFQSRVTLLTQLRFDYLSQGPAWAHVREIDIRDMTFHPIGDVSWLAGGDFAIGAGSQLFVYRSSMEDVLEMPCGNPSTQNHKPFWGLFDLVDHLNGPLPVYHPNFLAQCLLSGKLGLVQRIIIALDEALRYHVDGEDVDGMLSVDLASFYADPNSYPSISSTEKSNRDIMKLPLEFDSISEAQAHDLAEKLNSMPLPQLSQREHTRLADIINCVASVEKQRTSIDENATKYILFFQQHLLRSRQANLGDIPWREINWALHSSSQDILGNMISRHFQGKMLWLDVRYSGTSMWMSDLSALKTVFETVARNEYTRSDLKNPIDCSLFYLALRKKAVLCGLWRMAGWNSEQAGTLRLLQNDFNDPKWRTVALKNAYALLGKRRFSYAAAWFLLADSLKDAASVCLNQLGDLQLAVAVVRVYEGDESPVLRDILEERVLPMAARQGDHWLASWAFCMLNRRDMAARALVAPVHTLLESSISIDTSALSYLNNDPALVVLYAQLRQGRAGISKGVVVVSSVDEWSFVLRNARLYTRMGCDLLALDLVRNWRFSSSPARPSTLFEPQRSTARRDSLIVAGMPLSPDQSRQGDIKIYAKPATFEEPAANSLLDSFGF